MNGLQENRGVFETPLFSTVSDYESKGCKFESCWAHFYLPLSGHLLYTAYAGTVPSMKTDGGRNSGMLFALIEC